MNLYSRKHWDLLLALVGTQFKMKDQSTILGFVWSFLHPVIMLVILFCLFKFRFSNTIEYYPIYMLIGLVQFTHFSNCTFSSMRILSGMRQLTGSTIFPKELLVIASVIASSIEFVIAMTICIVIAVLAGVHLSVHILLLPIIILLQITLVFWVSMILSCFFVFIRDIDHIYQVFVRLLFFITPIFYDISFVGDGIARTIVLSNPLTHLIEFSRMAMLQGQFLPVKTFLAFMAVNSISIVIAIHIFKKFEPKFAEYL